MNKLSTRISIFCMIVIAAFGLAFCIISVIPTSAEQPEPVDLICMIRDYLHPEGRVVKCAKTGSDVSGNYADEPTVTETEYIYPTLEPTHGPYATPSFTPRATRTPTRTATLPPYPNPATATPGEPYP